MSVVKLIICGDVMGNFRALFPKIEELNKTRGPFEALYCVGNFFGPNTEDYEDLKSGKIEVPISTYILNGNQTCFKELYEPLEKAQPKIVYLGKMGRLIGSTGLKIAYLSGVELPENLRENKNAVADTFNKYNVYISRRLVKSMIDSVGSGTDILLTSQWPKDVTNYAISLDKDDEAKVKDASSYSIAYLAKYLKPRYHFCGMSGLYYERVPYRTSQSINLFIKFRDTLKFLIKDFQNIGRNLDRNHLDIVEAAVPVTRFIGLAPVKRGKITQKEKWMYGFHITPQMLMTTQELVHSSGPATVCPYGNTVDTDDVDRNFFFDSSVNSPGPSSSKKRGMGNDYGSQPKKPAIDGSSCWFCLSNPNVDKQLIISVGNHVYITLAKGVLVPEHVFIVPIEHIPSSVELCPEAFEEVENFKSALVNYFHDRDQDLVFFERNYRSPHLQIQAVPIPKQMQDEIEDKLYSHAYNFEVTPLPQLSNIKELSSRKQGKQENYFYFELVVNKKTDGKYLAIIENSIKDFPLQIGRQILADVLDMKDRVNWQECADSEEEKKMAERMQRSFRKYDFTDHSYEP